jgi:N-acetylmuramoyl-L-alanine amidase
MTDTTLIAKLTEAQVVGLTLWAEARGGSIEGRIAVANVIRNRVRANKKHYGLTARAVCLKPWQFSCWNAGTDTNHNLLMDTAHHLISGEQPGPLVRECLWIAQGLLENAFVDNTHGSSHYLTTALLEAKPPSWAVGQRVLAHIGGHAFMRAV